MHELLEIIDRVEFPHSAGLFYTAVTQFLGFHRYGEEWKMMGLAPYGKQLHVDKLRQVIRPVDGGHFELNLDYFRHCAAHDFHLQACSQCGRLRYPPTTACPWCASLESTWRRVEGKGAVHSYSEVHHAIQPAFRDYAPYLILLVDLDTQKGEPTPDEALRVVGVGGRL